MVVDHEVDYFQILDYRKIDLIDNTYHLVQRNRVCESCKDLKTIVSYFSWSLSLSSFPISLFILKFSKISTIREFVRGVMQATCTFHFLVLSRLFIQSPRAFAQLTNTRK